MQTNFVRQNNLNSVLNQFDYFQNLDDFFNQQLLLKCKNDFEKLDLEIYKSNERLANGWIVKDKRQITIITPNGAITFFRYRYFNKFDKKYKCLVDDHLQLKKYKRITNTLKIMILNHFAMGCNYRDIQKYLLKSNLSLQSILNVIKKNIITDTMIENTFYKVKSNINLNTTFHIETDDTFFGLLVNISKIKHRFRMLAIHNGVCKIKNRNYLKNLAFCYILKEQGKQINTYNIINQISKHIQKYYAVNLVDL